MSVSRRLLAVVLLVLGMTAVCSVSAAGSSRAATAHQRTITLVNRTDRTIWAASAPAAGDGRSGWVLRPGRQARLTVPDSWNGRIWGRTGCRFSAGRGHCVTGDCAGRFQCAGWGAIPATLAEYDLDAWDHLDFYDVSMVDGSNLPMWINIARGSTKDRIGANGCIQSGCTSSVKCPAKLVVDGGAGCESPCAKLGGARYCCTGRFAHDCDPATTWPVDYARVFKKAEPYAYSWSGDDATSVFTCTRFCDYRITFGVTPGRR